MPDIYLKQNKPITKVHLNKSKIQHAHILFKEFWIV